MGKYVMALDAGTTSNRCILFDKNGRIISIAQKEFTQYFPKPGWVEHDADEIWSTQLGVAVEAMSKVGASAEDIAAIGITNQRETAIVWDKETGEPVCPAIVWQCRRTAEYCDQLKEQGYTDVIRAKTGLEQTSRKQYPQIARFSAVDPSVKMHHKGQPCHSSTITVSRATGFPSAPANEP